MIAVQPPSFHKGSLPTRNCTGSPRSAEPQSAVGAGNLSRTSCRSIQIINAKSREKADKMVESDGLYLAVQTNGMISGEQGTRGFSADGGFRLFPDLVGGGGYGDGTQGRLPPFDPTVMFQTVVVLVAHNLWTRMATGRLHLPLSVAERKRPHKDRSCEKAREQVVGEPRQVVLRRLPIRQIDRHHP